MNKTAKALLILNIVLVFLLGAFFIGAEIMKSYDIRCFVAEKAHIYCPGCGGTRAVYSLLRLDIISSLKYNVAVPFSVIVYVYYNIKALISIKKGREDFFNTEKFILIYVLIGILLVNFILRNVLLWGFKIDFIGDFIA